MALPDFLAKPSFHVLYSINRRMEGGRIPPIRRVVGPIDPERRQAFDMLFDSALANATLSPIGYNLPYPIADFLNYLCDWRGVVAHGSQLNDLEVLEPVRYSHDDNEFGNRQQIFCSPDANWAMWFAILDKNKYGGTRNGCVRVGLGAQRVKYYHFELPTSTKNDPPFANGTIYLAQASDFPDHRPYPLLDWFNAEVEEWGSIHPVKPLTKIRVTPQDFPYFDKVQFSL